MSNPSGPPQGGEPNHPGEPAPGQPAPYQGQPPFDPGPGLPWGAPGDPLTAATGKRNLLPIVVAGAALFVVAIVLGVVLITNSVGSSGPKDSDGAFVAAAETHDCEKAISLITDDLKKRMNADCGSDSSLVPSKDQDFTFGDVTISGETDTRATATV